MNKKCPVCGSAKGLDKRIDGVPVWICRSCGVIRVRPVYWREMEREVMRHE